jgi:hypothetical protein
MNYKNAAGRNWTREARKSCRATLRASSEPDAVLATLPTALDQVVSHKQIAGRNWSRQPRKRRPVHLSRTETRLTYPDRERGGGDHDQPYDYKAPSWRWTFPFSEWEYARLLALRGQLRDKNAISLLAAPTPR